MRTWVLLLVVSTAALADNRRIFEEKLRPVLAKHCAACHTGPSAQSGFSVSTFDAVLQGGKKGLALLPGNAASSPLVQYVRGERTPRMPLGAILPEADIAAIAAAIDSMEKTAAPALSRDTHMEWLLRKPSKPEPPAVAGDTWVINPIDRFVLARLERKGLTPAPPAGRRTLIRRAYFDLLGLPPSPEAIDRFVSDTDPKAWEKLVDSLLADPRYGERWARHWLDLVRYAESDGFAIDSERPTVWRYRDYVIRAFNNDKPYDLFIKEQLAGDEMRDSRATEKDRSERLVALGYYRLGTWEADANSKKQLRLDFLNEVTGTTTATFLGLTVGCAQCHNHKYDPIPQRDFYRMQAFFAATGIDELPAPFIDAESPKEMKRLLRQYEDAADTAGEEVERRRDALKQRYIALNSLKEEDPKVAAFLRELGVQNAFFQEREEEIFRTAEWKAYIEARDEQRRISELARRYRPVAYAVRDLVPPNVPELPRTHVLASGDLAAPGEAVEPGFLESIEGKSEAAQIPFQGNSAGRRQALAAWIASAENPLTARVMVNRVWQQHFGEGIVRTPSDFGKNGARPTHPELLDWLAVTFVEKKWSLKELHRLMLSSATYQQASAHPEQKRASEIDPANELLWRRNWGRVDAESLRDSLLSLSGRLQSARGGPGVLLDVPPDVADGFEFFKWFASPPSEQLRRTIYTFQRRSVMNPMVEVFDGASIAAACPRRSATTVPPQALTLMNGELTNTEARHFAARVLEESAADAARSIERAFHLVLGRAPSPTERAEAGQLLGRYPPQRALEHLGAVLFNTNEFLYIE